MATREKEPLGTNRSPAAEAVPPPSETAGDLGSGALTECWSPFRPACEPRSSGKPGSRGWCK